MTISPWEGAAGLNSPNGAFQAWIDSAWEMGMGAPTSGTLHVSIGITLEGCSPSMVWSDDSEYLAVPEWTHDRRQRLVVVSMSRRTFRRAPGVFKLLRLESFKAGIVRGTDSPAFGPRPVAFDVSTLRWTLP